MIVDHLTTSNITFAIGIVVIIFAVYRYFRDPQVKTDKDDALLSQKVEWMTEASEKRFKDMQDSFQSLLLQSNNHIHTVDTKVEALTVTIVAMSNEITKLSTIIEERMPRKVV